MNIVTVAIIGMIGAILTVIIKQHKPEFAIYTSIITVVIIFSSVLGVALPIISDMKSMLNNTSIDFEHITILIKSVGICYLTQFVCDICRESGQTAIANKIEFAAKIAICFISLPLFHNLISVVEAIIGKVT